MPIPPASASSMPKTLAEAKQLISNLRRQLGHGPPAGGKPIPKSPNSPPTPNPDPTAPGMPGVANRLAYLSAMSPRDFSDFLGGCGDKELKILLARETAKIGKEQDEHVVAKLYREIKKRGRSA